MTDALLDALRDKREFLPDGFRDDDGVWHDGPHRAEFDSAVERLAGLVHAAELIAALHQAGGNEWWEAHAKLYLALNALGVETPYALTAELMSRVPTSPLVCEICGEPGGAGEVRLGRMDDSINDHEIAHEKCWQRDPECKCWTPLTRQADG